MDTTEARSTNTLRWLQKPVLERVKKRFRAKIDKSGKCWVWTGSFCGFNWNKGGGYGQMVLIDNYRMAASRFSYLAYHGDIPAGLIVCHTCDNSRCVNPKHLYVGTHKQNSQDMTRRNRCLKGDNHGNSKLSSADIPIIRQRIAAGEYCWKIGESFNVSRGAIWKIKHGLSWTHV